MKNNEIEKKLSLIDKNIYSLDNLENELVTIKKGYVADNNKAEAKQIRIYQTIIQIHRLFREAFDLLQRKKYFEGWCVLEKVEINFLDLYRHYDWKEKFKLSHIEKSVKNLQVIFPYRFFLSSEILKKKKECTICNKEVTIRTFCGHKVGEIYDGEICLRRVTDFEILGTSIVENPGNKYSVLFLQDEKTGKTMDQYNYDTINYLFKHLNSPYDVWNLKVREKVVQKADFENIGRNELCSCGSKSKFKKCCGKKIGKKYPYYEFFLGNPNGSIIYKNAVNNFASR